MVRVWAQFGERAAVTLITVGILCMIQPFVLALLAYGFIMVLAGLVVFMIVSHV